MGKRYGRNQKRRHREHIARLETDAVARTAAVNTANARISELHAALAQVHDIVARMCDRSIALPPKNLAVSVIREDMPMSMYDPPALRCNEFLRHPDDVVHRMYEYLHRVSVWVERGNPNPLTASIHLRVSSCGESAYMISRRGFQDMPVEILINEVAPQVARHLIEYLKRGMGDERKRS